jgi:two-component system, NarL family, response regulator DevR
MAAKGEGISVSRTAIRLLLADDHALVREGLRQLLADEPGLEVVGEAADAGEAVEAAARLEPDLVLLDILMPGGSGIEALRRIRARSPAVRVLMLTSVAQGEAVREALAAGAAGYLLKDVSRADLLRAVRDAACGVRVVHAEARKLLDQAPVGATVGELTPRERSVLELIAQGKSNRQIGQRLDLTEGTVKGYVSAILGKLGVEDRTQAALLAARLGLGGGES